MFTSAIVLFFPPSLQACVESPRGGCGGGVPSQRSALEMEGLSFSFLFLTPAVRTLKKCRADINCAPFLPPSPWGRRGTRRISSKVLPGRRLKIPPPHVTPARVQQHECTLQQPHPSACFWGRSQSDAHRETETLLARTKFGGNTT